MAADELIQKLAKLSQRERQVLGFVCAGLMYKDIAQNLYISLPTVKAVMGRVYVKLNLDQLDKAERTKTIYEIICPLLKTSPQQPSSMPPERNDPIPSSIMRMVDEDELLVITPPRREVINVPPQKRDLTSRNRYGWLIPILIVGVSAIVCLSVGLGILGGRVIPGLLATRVVTQIVYATEGIRPENTAVVPPTLAPVLPTTTPITREITVVVTDPPQLDTPMSPTIVIPAISLPFSDNFDNGVNPAWRVLSGNWLTADGRTTIANADNSWAFSVLDDPRWTNYRISVNVKRETSDEGKEAIIVRYLGNRNKFLAFHIVNIFYKGGWAFYDGNEFTNISGYGTATIEAQFNLEIEVVGNDFIARINGIETQRINVSGFEKGGVALGVNCFYPPCSSFDNFQINPIP